MLNNIGFPIEIQKFISKKRLKRIALFVALLAINLFVILMWGNSIIAVDKEHSAFKYACYASFLILPAVVTRIWKLFTDKSYFGTVKDIDIITTVDSTNSAHPTVETRFRKNEIYLTIEASNGKIIKKKADETPVKTNSKLGKYKIGDCVLHLYGTKLTVVLPSKKDTHCQCSVCGRINDISAVNCKQCALPLIKL